MGLLELFITACMPVLNMLLVTGVGSFLATDSAGILGKEARKHLNYVVFYVFNPALIATYLGKTITMESLAKLWFMPVNVFFTFILGLIFGWIVIKVTGAPLMLRGLILGCCSAGNLGNIFLIIIPALCKEKGSPFGAPDVCQTYGLAYSSLSLARSSRSIRHVDHGREPHHRDTRKGERPAVSDRRRRGCQVCAAASGGHRAGEGRGPLRVIRPDPLYQFVLLLQYAVPPAMNIGTITQLFGVGESECSVIFVWVYALASVAVTMWSAFFMWTLS
ncbi:unnamed protein product [Triticum turgidum subsp. durum]|uniref:Auxin efflux carrier component n=1 Tax=Triticum turgidum subsp. durum TaxID=4567 RepID=A0A9R0XBW8_TRITD|nr:unnamed protein product [Triticum turgidum subsp. durum]